MAFLNYPRVRGFAYKHDFQGWNQEMDRQEQMNMAKDAADQQSAMWLADKMKLGKTWSSYDQKGLQEYSKNVFDQIATLTQDDNWKEDPQKLSQIMNLGNDLMDNEWTQRSARYKAQQESLMQAMSNPDLAEDDDARMQLEQMLEQASNYDKFGNVSGIQDGSPEEFVFRMPVTFDANSYFNDQAKNGAGIETVAFNNGTEHGTTRRVKNMPDLISTAFSGKDGKRLERAFQKYKATGGNLNTKEAWFAHNINQRLDTGLASYGLNPQRSGGDGDGNTKQMFAPFEQMLKPKLYEAQQMSQMKGNEGKQYSVYTAEAYAFAPGFAGVDASSGVGNIKVPTNIKIPKSDGSGYVTIEGLVGQQKDVIMDNALVYVNGEPHVSGRMRFKAEKDKEFTDKILKDEEWLIFPTGPEDYGSKNEYANSVRPAKNAKGEDIPGEFEASFLLPADMSYSSIQKYDMKYVGTEKSATVQQARIESQNNQAYKLDVYAKQTLGLKPGQQKVIKNPNTGQTITILVDANGNVTTR
jgi:hypothetical protein